MMTTHETSRTVRWLVIAVLSTATAGMILVSLRANYLFGYGFGQSEEKAHVFGWANVAADLWKVTGLIVISALWRAKQRGLAVCLTPIWVLCLAWGLAGAVGVYAQDRTALIGGREATAATYKDREHELEEIENKLRALKVTRGVAQIDAAIEAVFARPITWGERMRGTVGKLSANCTKTDRLTAGACLEVASLREERAGALEAEQLEKRKSLLRVEITKMREGGGSLAADPVAELFAWLSRGQLSVRDIGFGFPLFFAFLIEFVSAFGPAGIVAYADATRRAKAGHSTPQHGVASSGELKSVEAWVDNEKGSVLNWLAERGAPTGDSVAVTVEDLHHDYEMWCRTKSVAATTRDDFADEFDRVRDMPEVAGKIRKFGTRYYGIRLVTSNVARLPARKQK